MPHGCSQQYHVVLLLPARGAGFQAYSRSSQATEERPSPLRWPAITATLNLMSNESESVKMFAKSHAGIFTTYPTPSMRIYTKFCMTFITSQSTTCLRQQQKRRRLLMRSIGTNPLMGRGRCSQKLMGVQDDGLSDSLLRGTIKAQNAGQRRPHEREFRGSRGAPNLPVASDTDRK